MAPKKKEKEKAAAPMDIGIDEVKIKVEKIEKVEESELLSRVPLAFKRNTQVYRMVNERHGASPLFLYRTLTYMRKRSSRNHERRKSFRVDAMLKKSPAESSPLSPDKYLTITYLGYYDESYPKGVKSKVRVETSIIKKCHNKRKDNAPVVKICLEPSEVPVNPYPDDDGKVPIISISPEKITLNNNFIKSRTLAIKVMREVNGKPEDFEVTYQVYNSRGQVILTDACYEASPGIQTGLWLRLQGHAKDVLQDPIVRQPKISFKLEWTVDSRSGWVDRPRPNANAPSDSTLRVTSATNAEMDNKENRPAKRVSAAPGRVGRPSRTCSTPSTTSTRPSTPTATTTEVPMDVKVKTEVKTEPNNDLAILPNGNHVRIAYNFQWKNNRMLTNQDDHCICPWCNLNCQELYSLFKHLKLCHERFIFQFTLCDNVVQIDISLNDQADRTYEGNPYNLVTNAIGNKKPRMRSSFTAIHSYRPRRCKPNLAEFFEEECADLDTHRPVIAGHDRLYFHTTTCLPVHPREMDNDPEAVKDPNWLRQKTIMMIDDFTDVNEGEKNVIKLWNLHVLKEGYVGDCQINMACSEFVDANKSDILKKNLYGNFILHLGGLFDFGLIGSHDAYKIIKAVKEGFKTEPQGVAVKKDTWLAQLKGWTESGGAGGSKDKAALETPLHVGQVSPSNCTKLTSYITGDGTLRRKMTQQTPQGAKKAARPVTRLRLPQDSQGEASRSSKGGSQDRGLRKRKLSLEEGPGEEPAKRARSGSLEPGSASKGRVQNRRKSTPPSELAKPTMRKSCAP